MLDAIDLVISGQGAVNASAYLEMIPLSVLGVSDQWSVIRAQVSILDAINLVISVQWSVIRAHLTPVHTCR